MRKPRGLRPGDRVAVVAPASPFAREDFDHGVTELARLGFEPVYDRRVFERHRYLAGEPSRRAASFLDAWCDPSIAAVVGARGGYGSAQILPYLEPAVLAAHAKVCVGCSDLTALLSVLTTKAGLVAVHGAMVAGQLGRGPAGYDEASWVACVTGRGLPGLLADGLDVLVAGTARGVLLGGNLTQLAASLGTPYAFDPPRGCILFLEDVGERPYRVDRLLTQLRLAGILGRASAVVFGEMLACDEPGGDPRCRDVVHEVLADFRGPVLFGLASGHTTGPALSLPLGIAATVQAGESGRITLDESPVEESST